jgi:DNA-binding CsgD family transcriptional regulator
MGRPVSKRGAGAEQGSLNWDALADLSRREEQVLSLAAAGFLDKQIGMELGVSLNTLRTYWTRIQTKVGEGSRSALAVAYVENLTRSEDDSPDWEVELGPGIWRKLSDRETPIEGPVGLEIDLEEVFSYFHEADRDGVRAMVDDLYTNSAEAFTYSARSKMPNGAEGYGTAFVRVMRDQAGVPIKLIGRRAPLLNLRSDEAHSSETIRHEGWIYNSEAQTILASDCINRQHGLEPGVPHPRDAYADQYDALDYAHAREVMDDVAAGKYETGTYRLRTLASGRDDSVSVTVHGIRNQRGDVVEVIGYRTRLHHASEQLLHGGPRLRVGFWAKDLRLGSFIVPDEEFCRIYRVDIDSPTLDRDISSRYKPEDLDAAYEFIDLAVAEGNTRGSRSFLLRFDDGTQQSITLEFFIERDEQGPHRVSGTVLAFG